MVTTELRRADGREIPCVVRFLAVPLPDGLEFSSFSSDLAAHRSTDEDEELLRERHARVVELLEAEEGNSEPVELDGPLAGIVVTFRSSAPGLITPDERLEDALERTERVEHEVGDMREPVTRLETQMGGLASQVEQAFKAMAELRLDIEKALAAGRDARQLAVDAQREADTTRRALAALRPAAGGVDPNGDDPAPPARPPRQGFDDSPVPMATLTLQGNFMELNPGFSALVGYSEEEFASARWPSNVDRARLTEHKAAPEAAGGGRSRGRARGARVHAQRRAGGGAERANVARAYPGWGTRPPPFDARRPLKRGSGLKPGPRSADFIPMLDVDAALMRVIEVEGSDLHLKVPMPPHIRRQGVLEAIPGEEGLKPEDTERILFHMLKNDEKLDEFSRESEVDFSYSLPGVARFRVNAFRQRGLGLDGLPRDPLPDQDRSRSCCCPR